jgi:hypothetical protein
LREAIERASRGSIDADLGGGIIKQRVARPGQGRSGGYRMLIAYRAGGRAVFLYAFAKNERDNIDPDELLTLREDAHLSQAVFARYLNLTPGYVSQLERGAKRPTGSVLVLLNVIRRKGIEAIL